MLELLVFGCLLGSGAILLRSRDGGIRVETRPPGDCEPVLRFEKVVNLAQRGGPSRRGSLPVQGAEAAAHRRDLDRPAFNPGLVARLAGDDLDTFQLGGADPVEIVGFDPAEDVLVVDVSDSAAPAPTAAEIAATQIAGPDGVTIWINGTEVLLKGLAEPVGPAALAVLS